jgi:hypothetical protein
MLAGDLGAKAWWDLDLVAKLLAPPFKPNAEAAVASRTRERENLMMTLTRSINYGERIQTVV